MASPRQPGDPPIPAPGAAASALLAIALLLGAPASAGEIYRWTDAQGRTHFTQDLSQVPATHRRQAILGASEPSAPSRLQTYSRTPEAAPAGAARGVVVAKPGSGSGPFHVPFERHGTVMQVEALLDGRVRAPFIVDTGASGVSIPQWVASRLGVRVGADTEWVETHTANGVVSRPVVVLESVELGGARVAHLAATVNPTLEVGLLGGSFFNNFVYRVDNAAGAITLTVNDRVRGGLSEPEWRKRFALLRDALARLDAYAEQLPETHRVRHRELATQRAELELELERLETEANRLGVPHTWR